MSQELMEYPKPRIDPDAGFPEGLLEQIADQVAALEKAADVLLAAQSFLPLPSPEEIAAFRRREKSVPREVYLLGQLQIASVKVENVASDLRTDLEYGFTPVEPADLVPSFFNAVESAVERLSGSDALKAARRSSPAPR